MKLPFMLADDWLYLVVINNIIIDVSMNINELP